jgi:membrane protein
MTVILLFMFVVLATRAGVRRAWLVSPQGHMAFDPWEARLALLVLALLVYSLGKDLGASHASPMDLALAMVWLVVAMVALGVLGQAVIRPQLLGLGYGSPAGSTAPGEAGAGQNGHDTLLLSCDGAGSAAARLPVIADVHSLPGKNRNTVVMAALAFFILALWLFIDALPEGSEARARVAYGLLLVTWLAFFVLVRLVFRPWAVFLNYRSRDDAEALTLIALMSFHGAYALAVPRTQGDLLGVAVNALFIGALTLLVCLGSWIRYRRVPRRGASVVLYLLVLPFFLVALADAGRLATELAGMPAPAAGPLKPEAGERPTASTGDRRIPVAPVQSGLEMATAAAGEVQGQMPETVQAGQTATNTRQVNSRASHAPVVPTVTVQAAAPGALSAPVDMHPAGQASPDLSTTQGGRASQAIAQERRGARLEKALLGRVAYGQDVELDRNDYDQYRVAVHIDLPWAEPSMQAFIVEQTVRGLTAAMDVMREHRARPHSVEIMATLQGQDRFGNARRVDALRLSLGDPELSRINWRAIGQDALLNLASVEWYGPGRAAAQAYCAQEVHRQAASGFCRAAASGNATGEVR